MVTKSLKRAPYGDLFIYAPYERNAPLWRRQIKRDARRFGRRQNAAFIAEGLADRQADIDAGPRFYKVRKSRQTDMLVSINSYTGDRYYTTNLESARVLTGELRGPRFYGLSDEMERYIRELRSNAA